MHEACRTCAPCPVICKIDPWCTSCTQNQARWFLWTRAFVISTPARAPPARASVMLFVRDQDLRTYGRPTPSGCVGLTRSRASTRPLSHSVHTNPRTKGPGVFSCPDSVAAAPRRSPVAQGGTHDLLHLLLACPRTATVAQRGGPATRDPIAGVLVSPLHTNRPERSGPRTDPHQVRRLTADVHL